MQIIGLFTACRPFIWALVCMHSGPHLPLLIVPSNQKWTQQTPRVCRPSWTPWSRSLMPISIVSKNLPQSHNIWSAVWINCLWLQPLLLLWRSFRYHQQPPLAHLGNLTCHILNASPGNQGYDSSYAVLCGFWLHPYSFPAECKVAYIISLLLGMAKLWATTKWEWQTPICSSYDVFSSWLHKFFDAILS